MQFSIRTDAPPSTDCAILPHFDQTVLPAATKRFDKLSRGRIAKARRSRDAKPRLGSTLLLRDTELGGARNVLLVGCGDATTFGAKQLGKALTAASAAIGGTSIRTVTSYLCSEPNSLIDSYLAARTTVQAMRDAGYRFVELKSKVDKTTRISRVTIVVPDKEDVADSRLGVRHGTAIANGMELARNLGNRPANVCTPSHLADVAREVAAGHQKMKLRVLEEDAMQKLGMGALLSVTRGAEEPAKLIVLEYQGGGKGTPPIALCGKGVTFDTGGISLKPPPKMDEMKFDMCGAAGVIGTMLSIAELGLDANVVAVVPACENMPGSRATRPGDIVTSLSGQTIEILNTDAEGRLILCDAISYALQTFEPRTIIDVATLTGACVIALGPLYTGVFGTDEDLTKSLVESGSRSLDEAWPLPADEEYGETLRSNFADFANSGGREGGASIAAQFLSRFVDDTPWAHLDIAGVAWKQNAAKGATGRPVPLLVDYLLNAACSPAGDAE